MYKLFIVVLLVSLSFSKEFEANYSADVSFLGNVGDAKLKYSDDGKRYVIELSTFPVEIVNTFSNNREESFTSEGIIDNGVLIPQKMIRSIKADDQDIQTIYSFDYKSKKIIKHTIGKKLVKSNFFDLDNFVLKREAKWKQIDEEKKLKYFSTNDVLTLYFNSVKMLQDKKGINTIYAAGASKSGEIKLSLVDGGELKKIKAKMNKDVKNVIAVNVTKKIFSDNNGKLYIGFDEQGFINEALLSNVILFGDIKGKKI